MMKKKIYVWRGILHGINKTGEITAFSENLAKVNLERKEIKVLAITKKSPFHKLNRKNPTKKDVALFFHQLATLTSAGVPISQALQILSKNAEHVRLSFILDQLQEDISSGKDFAQALKNFPKQFDTITCQLIQNGENTGTLDFIMERIAQQKEKIILLKQKIKQALFYPAMIMLVAMIVSTIMLTCIVPRFAELFQTMHSKLPAFTLLVIYLSHILRNDLPWIAILLLAASAALYCFRHHPNVQIKRDWIMINFPGLNSIVRKIILARFARNLATIFAAGIPITEALNMISCIISNLYYQKAIQKAHFAISTGKQLHAAIGNQSLFPVMMQQMIQIGEETGTLEKMLTKIADFYEADIDHLATHLSKLLEPLIMVILGVLIGGLVIAMYLPIFKLGTVI